MIPIQSPVDENKTLKNTVVDSNINLKDLKNEIWVNLDSSYFLLVFSFGCFINTQNMVFFGDWARTSDKNNRFGGRFLLETLSRSKASGKFGQGRKKVNKSFYYCCPFWGNGDINFYRVSRFRLIFTLPSSISFMRTFS